MTAPPLELDTLVDAIAARVVELLDERRPIAAGDELVWTTDRVAQELGRSEWWVREHRHELGVLPATGVKPRLLFDAAAVRAWATANASDATPPTAAPPVARPGRRRPVSRPDLLPIRGCTSPTTSRST